MKKYKFVILVSAGLILAACSSVQQQPDSQFEPANTSENATPQQTSEPTPASTSGEKPATNESTNNVESSEKTPEVIKLETPGEGLFFEDNVLHWEAVPHASGYYIRTEEGDPIKIRNPQFAVKDFNESFSKGQTVKFYLQAFSDSSSYSSSDQYKSSFTLPDTNDAIADLFSESRGYASLEGYSKTQPSGTDITKEVNKGLYDDKLEKAEYEGYETSYKKVEARMEYDHVEDWGVASRAYRIGNIVTINTDEKTNGTELVKSQSALSFSQITLSTDVYGGSVVIDNPTQSKINTAVADFRGTEQSCSIIKNGVRIKRVYNSQQLNHAYSVPLDVQIPNAPQTFDSEQETITISAKQTYFTVMMDSMANPYKYIAQSDEKIREFLSKGLCPAYVSAVEYGRLVSINITTENKDLSTDKDGWDNITSLEKYLLANNDDKLTIDYFIHGDASTKEGIITNASAANFSNVIDILNGPFNPQYAVPISYTLTYLDGTEDVVKLGSYSEYYVKEYKKIEAEEIKIPQEMEERLKLVKTGQSYLLNAEIYPDTAKCYKPHYYLLDAYKKPITENAQARIVTSPDGTSELFIKEDAEVGRTILLYISSEEDGKGVGVERKLTIRKDYTITYYDALTNEKVKTETVLDGSTIQDYLRLSKDGVSVGAIFKDKERTERFYPTKETIQSDLTLFVTWGGAYKITFTAVGGTVDRKIAETWANDGQEIDNPAIDIESNPNYGEKYEIENYYADKECQTIFTFGSPVTKDTEIFVKVKVKEFTVTYKYTNKDGLETSVSEQVAYKGNPKGPASLDIADGWSIEGWLVENSGSTDQVKNFGDYSITSTTVFVAVMKQNVYTLSLSSNDEELGKVVSNAGSTLRYGDKVTIEAIPTEKGKFVKWSDGNTNIKRVVEMTKDLSLKAEFEIKKFDVVFKDYDGTVLKTEKVEYGKSATPPTSEPERTGYLFSGWVGSYENVSGNVVVTASYTPVGTKRTITASSSSAMQYGESFTALDDVLLIKLSTETGYDPAASFTSTLYNSDGEVMMEPSHYEAECTQYISMVYVYSLDESGNRVSVGAMRMTDKSVTNASFECDVNCGSKYVIGIVVSFTPSPGYSEGYPFSSDLSLTYGGTNASLTYECSFSNSSLGSH